MNLSCSQCGSRSLTKTSFVYERGVTHGQSTSSGSVVGVGGGFFETGYIRATTHSTYVSSVAARVAPPEKKSNFGYMCMVVFFFGFPSTAMMLWQLPASHNNPGNAASLVLAAALLALGLVVLPIYVICKEWTYNRTVYPRLFNIWDRSFMCNRCGQIEIPSNTIVAGDAKGVLTE